VEIVVRPWQKGDLESIRRITWQSWISTYASFIPESDLKAYFDVHYTEEGFLSIFNDSLAQGFVAQKDDQVVGYARLFFNRDENRLYIPSLYFLPDFQGQGMGRRLLEVAEEYAAEKGLHELWIGVMVKNRQALVFYRKVGFQFVREEPFTMGKTTVIHLIGYRKLGEAPFLIQKTYATFDGRGRLKDLSRLCLELLSEQKRTWQDLREGYELLKDIKERDVQCKGFSMRLQQNPGRIRSSLADVREKNENERQCFLCLDRLPESQRGILYRDDYLILCNPMPVFSSHFTISHLDHRRQAVVEHIDTLLQLMSDFGSRWTILYNGPKCGASAPDHLHFQAIPWGKMPIEKETQGMKKRILITKTDDVSLFRVRDVGREVVLLEGDDPVALGKLFKRFLSALGRGLLVSEEPMINVAGFYRGGEYSLLIFPRRKHRPDAFFKEGDARVVVSPGVIDMGGLLITPMEKDFYRLDASSIEDVYGEVSLETETVGKAIDASQVRGL
jgi:ribosomal protein S18 acetylase RimI-like enzyme